MYIHFCVYIPGEIIQVVAVELKINTSPLGVISRPFTLENLQYT